jgi:hypothetical protein
MVWVAPTKATKHHCVRCLRFGLVGGLRFPVALLLESRARQSSTFFQMLDAAFVSRFHILEQVPHLTSPCRRTRVELVLLLDVRLELGEVGRLPVERAQLRLPLLDALTIDGFLRLLYCIDTLRCAVARVAASGLARGIFFSTICFLDTHGVQKKKVFASLGPSLLLGRIFVGCQRGPLLHGVHSTATGRVRASSSFTASISRPTSFG